MKDEGHERWILPGDPFCIFAFHLADDDDFILYLNANIGRGMQWIVKDDACQRSSKICESTILIT